ncbi:winged helix-turn-helix domain-containing protein [Rhodococcus artemisiae]|uniref:Winged helix-turn-helix domain-containing protein n=1 Tax=Rhodococcus artemisiae TaxID=714159 RepID=A0ABU7LJU4_9NOCA|nr:winged helix-turn-helix domain-containing protein [Rhodococcus artemisiae]MEE2061835.1 winged helix-turn-helix domain-containing protein [Rhodococcus artemisiae]
MSDDTAHPTGSLRRKLPTIRPKMLGIVAVAAMALFLAALAFTLSFDALRALAIEINVHPSRAWMAPVAIDVAQAAATAGYVIFRVSGKYGYARFYCMALAIVTVALSVVGNAYHSWQMAARNIARVAAGEDLGFVPQPPAIAAIIAAIFPLLWLALFHLFTMLLQVVIDERAQHRNATAPRTTVQPASAHDFAAAPSTAPHLTSVDEHAHTVVAAAAPALAPHTCDDNDATQIEVDRDSIDANAPRVAPVYEPSVANTTVVDEHADGATRNGYPQTPDGLHRFLADCNFTKTVKEVVAMLIDDPHLKQTEVAQRLHVDKSTVSRRWRLFVAAAETEGFAVPPLPAIEVSAPVRELQPA